MDDEQRKWSKQLSVNFGPKEFIRFLIALVVWNLILAGVGITLESFGFPGILIFATIFGISIFIFPILVYRWRPAYLLFRKILGNRNLPPEPMPPSTVKTPIQLRPWWSYLPRLWFTLMTLIAMYFAIKYLLK